MPRTDAFRKLMRAWRLDSFYSWQGYMEGACLSGIRAANEILADIKSGVL